MPVEPKQNSELKNRLFYGAVVGAIIGMIIGTMPANEPIMGILGMGFGAAVIGGLAGFSDSFWESLQSVWELLRFSFWRW